MRSAKTVERPGGRIVMRFALTSFLVFVPVGVAITYLRTRDLREREERAAASRAELIADEMVSPLLTQEMLATPLVAERYVRVDQVVERAKGNDPGIERVKIWGTDDTILYSDDRALVGMRPAPEPDLLEAIDEADVQSEISDLSGAENVGERPLADRLFETLRAGARHRGRTGDRGVRGLSGLRRHPSRDRPTHPDPRDLLGRRAPRPLHPPPPADGRPHAHAARSERTTERPGRADGRPPRAGAGDRHRTQGARSAPRRLRRGLLARAAFAAHEHPRLRSTAAIVLNAADVVTESADAIERQSSRMLRLVMNLLSESRIESGRSEGQVTSFNLGSLIEEVAGDFHRDGRRIRSAVAPDLDVCCDRGKVADVLVNLIDNALKYAPGSPVTVRGDVAEATLTFSVADEGPGIDPGDVGRIFDRFYQADQSATRVHGGWGWACTSWKGSWHPCTAAFTSIARPRLVARSSWSCRWST